MLRFSFAEDWVKMVGTPFGTEDGGDVGILDFFSAVAGGEDDEFVIR